MVLLPCTARWRNPARPAIPSEQGTEQTSISQAVRARAKAVHGAHSGAGPAY